MRWQPVQWQALVIKGLALIRNRTRPHRHPPSWTRWSLVITPPCFSVPRGRRADVPGSQRRVGVDGDEVTLTSEPIHAGGEAEHSHEGAGGAVLHGSGERAH